MSLLLSVAVVTTGIALGRLVVRATRKRPPPLPSGGGAGHDSHLERLGGVAESTERPEKHRAAGSIKPDSRLSCVCQLGDVVMRTMGDEAWLAGALVFEEDAPTLILFFAPEAGQDTSLLARPLPSEELVWYLPVESTLFPGTEPPSVVEHEGTRFERERRLPLSIRRIGAGAPDLGAQAVVAEYRASGFERLLVVVAASRVLLFRGQLLEPGMYDILPGERTVD
jgi:hypothetical protein